MMRSPVRILLFLPLLFDVTQAKFDVLSFVPETLRKAQQGLACIVMRQAPPPVPVIPHCTGHAALDQALFCTYNWGLALSHSFAQQCASMPALATVVTTVTPTALLLFVAHSWWQFVQSTRRSEERVKDSVQSVAWTAAVAVGMYQCQALLRAHPALVLGEAVLLCAGKKLWDARRNTALTLSVMEEEETHSVEKVKSIITMDLLEPEQETAATINGALEVPASTLEILSLPEEEEERSFQVNVTKISAVLDRFESKILSLVGGTRFAAKQEKEPCIDPFSESFEALPDVDIEMTQFAEDDLVEVLHPDDEEENDVTVSPQDDELKDSLFDHEASPETSVVEPPECGTSLSNYEIMTPSSNKSIWAAPLHSFTKSIVSSMALIGLVAGQVAAFSSIAPLLRHSLVTIAALCVLGLLLHELYQSYVPRALSTRGGGSLDALLQQVESSATSFSKTMDPLVVEFTRRPHLRFFRTRMPILHSVAMVAERHAFSSLLLEEEKDSNILAAEAEGTPAAEEIDTSDVVSTQCYYSKADASPTATAPTNVIAPILRRWATRPRSTPKVACTSIVGL